MRYRHLLAAIALDDDSATVLQRAQELARQQEAQLSVLHVVEYIPLESGEALMAMPSDLTQQLTDQARRQILQHFDACGVPESALVVASGSVARETRRVVEERGIDLIVVGHHPRNGWASLFGGGTEKSIVQHTPCDVLVVALSRNG